MRFFLMLLMLACGLLASPIHAQEQNARMRDGFIRVATRIALRKQMLRATADERQAIRTALRDSDVLDALIEGKIKPEFDQAVDPSLPILTWFQQFLQWVLDNRESIIDFIKAIVGLFNDVQPAALQPCDIGPALVAKGGPCYSLAA